MDARMTLTHDQIAEAVRQWVGRQTPQPIELVRLVSSQDGDDDLGIEADVVFKLPGPDAVATGDSDKDVIHDTVVTLRRWASRNENPLNAECSTLADRLAQQLKDTD